MKYQLCWLAIFVLLLASCSEKVKIGEDQARSFVKFYGNQYEDKGNDVKTLTAEAGYPQGGYIVTGYTVNTNADGSRGDKDLLFLKLDRFGNIIGKPKKYGDLFDDEGNSIEILPDGGGFIIAGYTTSSNNKKHVYIVQLDAKGDSLKTLTLGDPSTDEVGNVIHPGLSGHYYIAGYKTKNIGTANWIIDYDITSGDTSSFDLSFDELTDPNNPSKTLEGISNVASDALITAGSHYLILGSIAYGTSKIFLAQSDNYGLPAWANLTFLQRNTIEAGHQLLMLPDNRLLILGNSKVQSVSGLLPDKMYLEIDSMGNSRTTINSWYLPLENSSFQFTAISMRYISSEGSLAIAGNIRRGDLSGIFLMKVDLSNGKEMWRREYGQIADQGAGGLDLTTDGGFIITGYNKVAGSNQSILIIKTNKDGFIE